MFAKIPLLDQFVILLNKCNKPTKVFELLLKRMCRVISHNEELNIDEMSKLGVALGLDEKETRIVISTLKSILEECVYYVAKPNLVLEGLNDVGIKEEIASITAQVWSNSARTMVDNVRKQKALLAKAPPSNKLKNIDYSITVQLGTDQEERVHRQLEPTAIFNLSGDDKYMNDGPIVFEADYNALYDLYQNIECIQEKLDELKA